MASFSRSEYIDNLTVNNIFTPPRPAFQFLVTDGNGGTSWTTISSLSSLIYGASYHTIKTSVGTYNANEAAGATFSLLDGPNAGLVNDPTASNTVHLYAKAFGQFDISGGNTLSSYDPIAKQVNSNILFVGTGGINIKGDPQTNTMYFDGRELPFISTMPYSFNQLLVYSNVPLNTTVANTNKSLIMQAQGPSSILSLVGEDIVVIKTNYQTNQIKFTLSSLNLAVLSTLVDHDKFLFSSSVTKADISSFSTSYGLILNLSGVQSIVCTMSTTLDNKMAYNSTIIGNVRTYSLGISSIWRQYVKESYLNSISTSAAIVSSSSVLQSEIDQVSNRVNKMGEIITTSTIITPYFLASTIVDLVNAFQTSIAGGSPTVQPLNVVYYPTYNSYYTVFNDLRPFGKPIQPSIYTSDIDLISGNATITNMTTDTNVIFSTMYTIGGTFAFYPNEDPHPFSVSWTGNLSLNINGSNYTGDLSAPYPRVSEFVTSNINASIIGQPICLVNFTYSKINAGDSLQFTNFTDFVDGPQVFRVAPIYQTSGYNTKDTPLLTQSITTYPKTFASVTSVAPYLELSTYVVVASTFYTAGCNTQFPINATGYKSFSFLEHTTSTSKVAVADNLSNFVSVNAPYSASNTFGYGFNSVIPNSAYTLQLVYGRQDSNNDSLTIGSIYNDQLTYRYTPVLYVSSVLNALTISSSQAEFTTLNTRNMNTLNGSVSSLNVSSLIGRNGIFYNTITQSSLITNLIASSISTTYANVSQLQVSSIVGSNVNIRSLVVSSISSTYASLSQVQVSSIIASNVNIRDLVVSSISSTYANVSQLQVSSMVASNVNIRDLAVSSVSSTYANLSQLQVSSIVASNVNIRDLAVSSISSTYANVSQLQISSMVGSNVNIRDLVVSSISSTYASLSQLQISSIVGYSGQFSNINTSNLSSYNATFTNIKASSISSTYIYGRDLTISSINNHDIYNIIYGGTDSSTVSTLYRNILLLTSTISCSIDSFSSSLVPVLYDIIDTSTVSTIYKNILLITSTIDSDLSTFSSSLHSLGAGGPDTSTISTIYANINLVTSTIEGDLSSFSSSLVYPGELRASTIFTSSIQLAGLQQPFIQYGRAQTTETVVLLQPYKDASYIVQATYSNHIATTPLTVSIGTSNSFSFSGDNTTVFWTTYGNIF